MLFKEKMNDRAPTRQGSRRTQSILSFQSSCLGVLAFILFFGVPVVFAAQDDTQFFYDLARKHVATNADVAHALFFYIDGTDSAPDYAARIKFLKDRKYLPSGFNGKPDAPIERGPLAIALCKLGNFKGGLTSHLFGATERYCTRTLVDEGIYPESSPNMSFTGTEFCSILGKVEDVQQGNPNRAPAEFLPGEIGQPAVAMTDDQVEDAALASTNPLLLSMQNPSAEPIPPQNLSVIITGVEGPLAQFRKDENSPWEKAVVGTKLNEKAEFRTGIRSAIRFVIPPDHTYTLDRLGTTKVVQAVFDGQKIKTEVAMEQGRVRLDVAPLAERSKQVLAEMAANPVQLQEAGIRHESTIRSPNSALAVRGTKVSLFDQPPYAPEAVSLTGTAQYTNTRRQLVSFGGKSGTVAVAGDQTSAAQAGLIQSFLPHSDQLSRNDYNNRLISMTVARGGFISGDVIVGNSDIRPPQLFSLFAGALDFVLTWNGGTQLHDLNLGVASPLSGKPKVDFVLNPPFLVSLFPKDPKSIALRAERYPEHSPSGGSISKNHIGPQGLEIASWPKNFPGGTYQIFVYNLLDPRAGLEPSNQGADPVAYNIDVYLNKTKIGHTTGSVGFEEIKTANITIPAQSLAQLARPRHH